MKKQILSIITAAMLTMTLLSGCQTKSTETSAAAATTAVEATAAKTTAVETSAAIDAAVKVGSLKGPTSMGLVYLMDKSSNLESENNYEFTMVTAADELLGKVVSGDIDIALLPANVASILYGKTNKGISVIDINTLGVLYIVSGDTGIKTIADLKGKTINLTGKGQTPEYVINYLLDANGLSSDDVTLEFKSEATEVASVLSKDSNAIGLLPQPFATVAMAQNPALNIVLDLTKEWDNIQTESGSSLLTGVTVVRNAFLNENKDAVDTFIKEHKESAQYAVDHVTETSELVAAQGIIEKAPVAAKALPYCNITCITGEEMKSALNGYLEVLFAQDPTSVGGSIPGDDFYYMP